MSMTANNNKPTTVAHCARGDCGAADAKADNLSRIASPTPPLTPMAFNGTGGGGEGARGGIREAQEAGRGDDGDKVSQVTLLVRMH